MQEVVLPTVTEVISVSEAMQRLEISLFLALDSNCAGIRRTLCPTGRLQIEKMFRRSGLIFRRAVSTTDLMSA